MATAKLPFWWAPRARLGVSGPGPPGRGMARGAKPRPSRSTIGRPAPTRITESSRRLTISRPWLKTPSARWARREPSVRASRQRGSPERLALVATTAPPKSSSSRWCRPVVGPITPSQALPPATSNATARVALAGLVFPEFDFRRSSRIGATGPSRRSPSCSESWQWALIHGRGAIRARGLAGRPLRRRNSAMAGPLRASTSSWKPPMPCTATISPRLSAPAAAAMHA